MGVVWKFLLSSILSSLSPSLWETARYRLKYCLKGLLNPKQPTNQSKKDILVVQGDWNAKVGKVAQADWGEVCGPYCNVETNERVLRLLEFATFNNKHPWPSQTIQKMDMAQPRWETPQPDGFYLGEVGVVGWCDGAG